MIVEIGASCFATAKNISDADLCALRRIMRGAIRCKMVKGFAVIDVPAESVPWSISDGMPLVSYDLLEEAGYDEVKAP